MEYCMSTQRPEARAIVHMSREAGLLGTDVRDQYRDRKIMDVISGVGEAVAADAPVEAGHDGFWLAASEKRSCLEAHVGHRDAGMWAMFSMAVVPPPKDGNPATVVSHTTGLDDRDVGFGENVSGHLADAIRKNLFDFAMSVSWAWLILNGNADAPEDPDNWRPQGGLYAGMPRHLINYAGESR